MTPEEKEYEEQLQEWALHQKPVNLQAAIIGMEATEMGVTLTVAVDYPPEPKPPENLKDQPENVKEALHKALVRYWKVEASIAELRLGPILLQHPLMVNPFLRELAREGANWQSHREHEERKAAGSPPQATAQPGPTTPLPPG